MHSSVPLSTYVSRVRESGTPTGLTDQYLLTPGQVTQIFGGVKQATLPLLLMAKLGISVRIAPALSNEIFQPSNTVDDYPKEPDSP